MTLQASEMTMDAPVNHTAHVTYQDVPESEAAWKGDELACFYCGERQVMILDTCAKCDKHMCHACLEVTGGSCSCHLTDEKIVEFDSFTPNPNEDKVTTFKKKQKRVVKEGADLVKKTRQSNVVRLNKFGDQQVFTRSNALCSCISGCDWSQYHILQSRRKSIEL